MPYNNSPIEGGCSPWRPINTASVLEGLPKLRLLEIAARYRIPVGSTDPWPVVAAAIERDPSVQAVKLIHFLSHVELKALCRRLKQSDDGPTVDVLARLAPLCEPSDGA